MKRTRGIGGKVLELHTQPKPDRKGTNRGSPNGKDSHECARTEWTHRNGYATTELPKELHREFYNSSITSPPDSVRE